VTCRTDTDELPASIRSKVVAKYGSTSFDVLAFVEPVPDGAGTGRGFGAPAGVWVPGVPRPDHGVDLVQLVCAMCDSTWVGCSGEACEYCLSRLEREAARATDESAATRRIARIIPLVLRCDECGRFFDQNEEFDGHAILLNSVCGVNGGPCSCNGRLRTVAK